MNVDKPIKPLGFKAYGSIGHLPGSRRGPADRGLSEGEAALLTEKCTDRGAVVFVQEKLDGSNVAVARIGNCIYPLMRAGYLAKDSRYQQHHVFHDWAMRNELRFLGLLRDGERCVGEWLFQAHGTRYILPHEPFVVFDIMTGHSRIKTELLYKRSPDFGFIAPRLISAGRPISVADVLKSLEPSGHGAIDPVEGAVWRLERDGKPPLLGKYVRHEKTDGCYLERITGGDPIFNTFLDHQNL